MVGQMSQNAAAKLYKIPRQTLNDRILKVPKIVGKPTRLSNDEERKIVETCNIFSEWGYGIGKNEVLNTHCSYTVLYNI